MKLLLALLLACALFPAAAQPGRHGGHREGAYGGYGGYGGQRPMPPPERRMGYEERYRMREQVRSGQMSREEARQQWREQRGYDQGRFSPQQREQLRRDVQETNRDLERR